MIVWVSVVLVRTVVDCQQSLFGQSAAKLITRVGERIKTSSARRERANGPAASPPPNWRPASKRSDRAELDRYKETARTLELLQVTLTDVSST